MEQSPSWEANQFSPSQEIPRIVWNPNVHCRIHKCQPPVPILSQLDPVQAPHRTSWRPMLILSSHLRLSLPSGLFPSGVLTKTRYTPLPHNCHMPRPSHSSQFDRPNNIYFLYMPSWCGQEQLCLFHLYFKGIRLDVVAWIDLAEKMYSRQTVVETIMNIQMQYKAGNFLSSWTNVSFSIMTLFLGITGIFRLLVYTP